jgi:hypothetical protein
MTTETNGDKQTEPRLLSEAETDTVAGGDAGTAAAVYQLNVLHRWLGLPPPPPCPCRD